MEAQKDFKELLELFNAHEVKYLKELTKSDTHRRPSLDLTCSLLDTIIIF